MDTSKPTDRLNVKKVMIYGAQAIAWGIFGIK